MRTVTVAIILLSAVMVAAGITAVIAVLNTYHNVIEYDAEISVIKGNGLGFNIANDKLYFGSVPVTGGGARLLKITNPLDEPARMEFAAKGDIAQFLQFPRNMDIVKAHEKTEAEIKAYVPKDTPVGNYSGKVIVAFRRIE